MSPAGRLHLDPDGMAELLALPVAELRVLLALISLAPDGELTGMERKLAARASLSGVAELREVLAHLAARTNSAGQPWLSRDLVRGEVRLRLSLPDSIAVRHPVMRARTGSSEETPAHRGAPARSEGNIRDSAVAAVRAIDPGLGEMAEAWIAHLASLDPSGTLPLATEVRNWVTIERLISTEGADAVAAALLAGMKNVHNLDRQPERYLVAAARGASAAPVRRVIPGATPVQRDEVF